MNIIKVFFNYLSNLFRVVLLIGKGVKFSRPFSVKIRGKLQVGNDIYIGSNVNITGDIQLGDGVCIEDNCSLSRSNLFDGVRIKSNSLVEDSTIGPHSFVGPFARIRANSKVGKNAQIGNFVEIKNCNIGNSARINHMAFIGDAEIDDEVTIGAGVITCNHDGLNINRTQIKKGAYVGSNSNLVAPVVIEENSTIGSGSTITSDTLRNTLTLARSRQITVEGWEKKTIKEEG